MQDIKFYIDANDDATFFTVRAEGSNLPEGIVRQMADWALSMEMSIDMEDLDSAKWDVSRPEEDDMGTWYVEYSREL